MQRTPLRRIASATFLVSAALVAQSASQPRVETQVVVHDFGTVPPGEKLEHDFALRNGGSSELTITQVQSSCGCTVASFDRTIAPGGEGRIHTELDTTDLRGALAKHVEVYTNDPSTPIVRLTLKALVQPHIDVVPGHARYLVVRHEAPSLVAQTVWANDLADFRLLAAESPYPFLRVDFREAAEAERLPEGKGRQWHVELTLMPDAEAGPLGDFVVLETNHPQAPTVRVPVGGMVRPVLAVVPPVADFGKVNLASPKRARLEIRNFASEAISLTGVDSGLPSIEARIESIEEGRRYQLLVTLQPSLPKGDFSSILRVHTSSPKLPTLEVALKGTVL
jgi:hypothetical protein